MFIAPKIDDKNFYIKLGGYIASWMPVCTTVGYIATRIFTDFNPISGAILAGSQFFLGTLGGYSVRKLYPGDRERQEKIMLISICVITVISIFFAVMGAPYVEIGISFAASYLPPISFPSVSNAFA